MEIVKTYLWEITMDNKYIGDVIDHKKIGYIAASNIEKALELFNKASYEVSDDDIIVNVKRIDVIHYENRGSNQNNPS